MTPVDPEEVESRAKRFDRQLNELLREHLPVAVTVDEDGEVELNEEPSCFPTRYVLVAEHADYDGERWLRMFTTDGMEPWDVVGLLHTAMGQL